MKRKLALALALILALSLCLAGCSGSPAATPTPAGGDTEQTPSGSGGSEWPAKGAITLWCGYSAGGSSDLMCRILAESLGEKLGQTVVVEDITGAGGFVCWNKLYKETEPDGYTFALINTPNIAIAKENPTTPREFNAFDFELLANHVTDYCVVAWRADETRWTDFASLVEYAKENELLYGASSVGLESDDDTIAQTLNQKLGTKFTVVVTEGSKDNETFLLNKSTDVLFGNIGDTLTGMQSGNFTVGCVFAPERSNLMPDVATTQEQIGEEIIGFSSRGYAFPAGVEQEIVDKMIAALDEAINDPNTIAQMDSMGAATNFISGDDYYTYLDNLRTSVLETFGLERVD